MGEEKLPDYPAHDDREFGYEVARTTIDAVASLVPGGSYAVGKLVERFVAAPLQKRRDEWFERVGSGLRDLEERFADFDPSALNGNDDFVSAVFEATQAAMKTAKEEKLEALRNGVLNIANGMKIEDTLRGSFFMCIDRFTPGHILVLRLLSAPEKSEEMRKSAMNMLAGSQRNTLRAAIPESAIDEPSLNRILGDLHREGLADSGSLNVTVSKNALLSKRTTSDGDAFLRFVSDPAAREGSA